MTLSYLTFPYPALQLFGILRSPQGFSQLGVLCMPRFFLEKHLVEELLILQAQDFRWIPTLNFLAKLKWFQNETVGLKK